MVLDSSIKIKFMFKWENIIKAKMSGAPLIVNIKQSMICDQQKY